MAVLTPELIAKIEARIAIKEAQLAAANTTYTSLLSKEVNTYKLDTTAAEQWVERQKLDDLRKSIEALEADIDALYRQLNGSQVVSVRLRRKW